MKLESSKEHVDVIQEDPKEMEEDAKEPEQTKSSEEPCESKANMTRVIPPQLSYIEFPANGRYQLVRKVHIKH